jgi:Ca-activated chloride channel homolog
MFSFQHSNVLLYLWILPLMLALFFYYVRWQQSKMKLLGNQQVIQHLLPKASRNKYLKFILFLLVFVLLILTLAGPRIGTSIVSETKQSKDIVFCLDISNSMNALDVGTSRLEKAKLFLQQFIQQNNSNQIGLVVFAGNAYISVPLTLDANALILNIQVLSSGAITAQGTNIGAALKSAQVLFNNKSNSAKSIVVITDGEDHEDDFENILETCKEENIVINTIGIGNSNGIEIMDIQTNTAMLDDNGQHIVSKLNDDILKKMANKTGGNYFLLQNIQSSISSLNNSIHSITGSQNVENKYKVYNHYFQYVLIMAIVLLCMYLLVPFFYIKSNSKIVKAIILACFFTAFQEPLLAQEKEAKLYLKEGKLQYKNKNFPDAIAEFQKVLLQSKATALQKYSALFNMGNSYCRQQQWQSAIDNYKQSLAINPNSLNAKNNLVYAQKKLEQQKKHQEQQENQSKTKPNNKDSSKPKERPKQQHQNPQKTPSKLTPQQAKQLLDGLKQDEQKILKNKIGNNNPAQNKFRKDW